MFRCSHRLGVINKIGFRIIFLYIYSRLSKSQCAVERSRGKNVGATSKRGGDSGKIEKFERTLLIFYFCFTLGYIIHIYIYIGICIIYAVRVLWTSETRRRFPCLKNFGAFHCTLSDRDPIFRNFVHTAPLCISASVQRKAKNNNYYYNSKFVQHNIFY